MLKNADTLYNNVFQRQSQTYSMSKEDHQSRTAFFRAIPHPFHSTLKPSSLEQNYPSSLGSLRQEVPSYVFSVRRLTGTQCMDSSATPHLYKAAAPVHFGLLNT
ncbi:hypothetical protein CEXT_25601 [Caerostris extrusa]|uniref:Uncharacterized protein n=1 Tax=Caerostris extrusa TaxID=172846 RepID=A0AAV4Y919_CAEEX|nr:hypothetical protein CEXT_25601 [Caerostris extrusa]